MTYSIANSRFLWLLFPSARHRIPHVSCRYRHRSIHSSQDRRRYRSQQIFISVVPTSGAHTAHSLRPVWTCEQPWIRCSPARSLSVLFIANAINKGLLLSVAICHVSFRYYFDKLTIYTLWLLKWTTIRLHILNFSFPLKTSPTIFKYLVSKILK